MGKYKIWISKINIEVIHIFASKIFKTKCNNNNWVFSGYKIKYLLFTFKILQQLTHINKLYSFLLWTYQKVLIFIYYVP